MKRKILIEAAVCVISLACVFGATACNNGDEASEPSVQVTEAEWNAAFEKTNAILSASDTLRNVTLSIKRKTAGPDDDGLIHKATTSFTIRMVENERYLKIIYPDGMTVYEYCLTEGTDAFSSGMSSLDDDEWRVVPTSIYVGDLNIGPYSEFTYENGQYITAYVAYDIKTTIKVKINADGYIFYYSYSVKWEETGLETFYIEYEFYDFGTTTLNVPAAAKQVIADYKAANN